MIETAQFVAEHKCATGRRGDARRASPHPDRDATWRSAAPRHVTCSTSAEDSTTVVDVLE